MPGTTRILLFNSLADAQNDAHTRARNGKTVVCIGPSNKVVSVGNAPSKIEWDSGSDVDWWIVIETIDTVSAAGTINELP